MRFSPCLPRLARRVSFQVRSLGARGVKQAVLAAVG